MKRYHVTVSLTHPGTFSVDLLANDFVNGSRPMKVFVGWGPFTAAMLDLGLDAATIKAMIPDFAQTGFTAAHDIDLEDDAVARFGNIGV